MRNYLKINCKTRAKPKFILILEIDLISIIFYIVFLLAIIPIRHAPQFKKNYCGKTEKA